MIKEITVTSYPHVCLKSQKFMYLYNEKRLTICQTLLFYFRYFNQFSGTVEVVPVPRREPWVTGIGPYW